MKPAFPLLLPLSFSISRLQDQIRASIVTAAGVLALLNSSLPAASADVRAGIRLALHRPQRDAGLLRYRWQAGKSYAYSVHIEADSASSTDTENGTVTYTVTSAGSDSTTLACRGSLIPTSRSKGARFGGIPRPPMFNRFRFGGLRSSLATPNEVKIDSYGRVLSTRGDSPLPRALGELTLLVIEPLSRDNANDWQTSTDCAILLTEVSRLNPRSAFGREETTRLPAQEQAHYTVRESRGVNQIIKKHYELRTAETVAGRPRIEMVGDGEITLASRQGGLSPHAAKDAITAIQAR